MHRGGVATRRVRRALLVVAAWSAVGATMAAHPAHAAGLQHCQAIKGTIAASPGLTDVPSDQAITLLVRVTGCSRTGGAALLAASTGASQATCAGLTTAMLPATATFAWANGMTSTVSLAFASVPGAPNRLALDGRVVAGAGLGDRIQGGLHLSATFTRSPKNATPHHKKVETSRRKEEAPLTGGNCTAANPLASIKVSSYQSLRFSATDASSAATSTTTTTRAPASAQSTTTVSSTSTTLPRRQAARLFFRRPPPPAPRAAAPKVVVVGDASRADSGIDPESVLGAVCIGAAVCLLILLLMPSRRIKRRRGSARLVR